MSDGIRSCPYDGIDCSAYDHSCKENPCHNANVAEPVKGRDKSSVRSAIEFIDNNAKTKTAKQLAEMAVRIAEKDLIDAFRLSLTYHCPHADICGRLLEMRDGCHESSCPYIRNHIEFVK